MKQITIPANTFKENSTLKIKIETMKTPKEKAMELLDNSLNKCSERLLFTSSHDVIIRVPKYFHDLINNGRRFKYKGFAVEIGSENEIIIFDKSIIIFKYKL